MPVSDVSERELVEGSKAVGQDFVAMAMIGVCDRPLLETKSIARLSRVDPGECVARRTPNATCGLASLQHTDVDAGVDESYCNGYAS